MLMRKLDASPPAFAIVCFSTCPWGEEPPRLRELMRSAARVHHVTIFEPVAQGPITAMSRRTDPSGLEIVSIVVDAEPASSLAHLRIAAFQDEIIGPLTGRPVVAWFAQSGTSQYRSAYVPDLTVLDSPAAANAFADAIDPLRLDLILSDHVFASDLFGARARYAPDGVDLARFNLPRHSRDGAPCIGFCGPIDDRLDLDLIDDMSAMRPDWRFIFAGDQTASALPTRGNIAWRTAALEADKPALFASWDAAWMPFARNDKTLRAPPAGALDYVAAGLPLVATSMRMLMRTLGAARLCAFADDAMATEAALRVGLAEGPGAAAVRRIAIGAQTWGRSWRIVEGFMRERLGEKQAAIVEPVSHSLDRGIGLARATGGLNA